MKDYFNLYGENNEEKLKELEKKGAETLGEINSENSMQNTPLESFDFDSKPDFKINQQAFDTTNEEQPSNEDKQQPPEEEPSAINDFSEKDLIIEQDEDNIEQEEFDDSDVNMKVVQKARKKALKKARKKKKRISRIIWTVFVIAASCLLAVVAINMGKDVLGITTESDSRKAYTFAIAEGTSTNNIIDTLEENDIIDFPLVFKLYCKLKNAEGTFKFGKYTMYNTYNYDTIISMLQSEGAKRETVAVTIPEGATLEKIRSILVENNVCTADQFNSVVKSTNFDADFGFLKDIPNTTYHRFEGYLYPDTYEFFCASETYSIENYGSSNAESAVEKMLQKFSDSLPENYESKIKSLSKYGINSLNDVVALASIVELECNGEYSEMSSVAAIFLNRLTWTSEPHFLGSTPTYYYPDNRYNTNAGSMTITDENGNTKTYKAGYEGLPPGAQCSMVKEAIDAVLNANTEYLGQGYYYFVTDSDANYYYNQTLQQHNNTINDLIAKGKWDA